MFALPHAIAPSQADKFQVGQYSLPQVLRDLPAAHTFNLGKSSFRSGPGTFIQEQARIDLTADPLLQLLRAYPLLQAPLAKPRQRNRQRNLPRRSPEPERVFPHRHHKHRNVRLHASPRQPIQARRTRPAQPRRRLRQKRAPRQRDQEDQAVIPARQRIQDGRVGNARRFQHGNQEPADVGRNEGDGGEVRTGRGEASLGGDALHGLSSGAGVQRLEEQDARVQEDWEGIQVFVQLSMFCLHDMTNESAFAKALFPFFFFFWRYPERSMYSFPFHNNDTRIRTQEQ